MKLNEKAWANASAATVAVIYVVCAVSVFVFPEFSKTVTASWFHGIDTNGIWTGEPRGNFVLGLVSAVAGTWLVGWLFAYLYNKLSK